MYNEQELIYLYHLGSQEAYDLLFQIYQYKFEIICKSYCLNTSEIAIEDYVQIIMISFFKALDHYRFDKNTKVQTYFMYVLTTSLKSAMRYHYNKKHIPYDKLISLSSDIVNDIKYEDILEEKRDLYKPDICVLLKESIEKYQYEIYQVSSSLEKKVFDYSFYGYTFDEIAGILDIDIKKVYNANYRLQKKMAKLK